MSWARLPDNPFVGLRPFESHESLLFFGRHEQTVELLEQLHATRFLAVVGSSGSGKSSLVRAGLIPKLEAGFLVEERDAWRVAIAKPGDAPLANLAAALGSALGDGTGPAAEAIRERGLPAVLEPAAAVLADANLLLVVDQFEELFRYGLHTAGGERGEEAAQFVALLLELAEQRELPVYVAMTMRSDFLGDCDAFFGLPEAMNRSQYLVPRLTRRQRREAIEGPVKLYRAAVAPRLVDRLLNETVASRDDLPVLQHALMRTWRAWRADGAERIDVEHYETAGTIHRALSLHAEEALDGMDEAELDLTRRIFQALTETDAGNRRIRRPAHLGEIAAVTGAGRRQIRGIIDRFRSDGRSFLVVSSEGDGDDPLIDISHESLIRQWQRLEQWVDEEAESARVYRRLADTAALREEGKAELYRGAALELAESWRERQRPNADWAARYDPSLDRALGFLDASRADADRRARDKEEARRRELRRTRIVAGVLGLAFLLSFAASYWAWSEKKKADAAAIEADTARQEAEDAQAEAESAKEVAQQTADRNAELKNRADGEAERARQQEKRAEAEARRAEQQAALALERERDAQDARREAEKQQRQAQARYLESQAEKVLGESGRSVVLSALLATESLALADTPEGHEAWRNAFARLPQALFKIPGDPATAATFSPDGEVVAAVRVPQHSDLPDLVGHGELVLYRRHSGEELTRAPMTHPVYGLLYSPDGRFLVAGGLDNATVLDASDLTVLQEFLGIGGGAPGRPPGMAFSADGGRLALGSNTYLLVVPTDDWQAEPLGIGLPDYGLAVAAGPGGDASIDFIAGGSYKLAGVDLEAGRGQEVVAEREVPEFCEGAIGDKPVLAEVGEPLLGAWGNGVFLLDQDWRTPERFFGSCQRILVLPPSDTVRSLDPDRGWERFLAVSQAGSAYLGRGNRQGFEIGTRDRQNRPLRDFEASGAISPGGRWIVGAGFELELWGTEALRTAVEFRRLAAEPIDTAWAPDGPLAVLHGSTLTAFDPSTWNEVAAVELGCDAASLDASSDGAWLAARCREELRIVDAREWRVVESPPVPGVRSLRFSPDSTALIATAQPAEEHSEVVVFEAPGWQAKRFSHESPLTELLWGPRPGFFATGTSQELTYHDFPDIEARGRWSTRIETTRIWQLSAPETPVAVRRERLNFGQAPFEPGVQDEGRAGLLQEAAMGHNLGLEDEVSVEPSSDPWLVKIDRVRLQVSSNNAVHLLDEACSRLPRDLTKHEAANFFGKPEARTTCAERAGGHRARGRDLARLGYPEPALAALRRALELDPELGFDPVAEQRAFAAQRALEEGRELARAGDLDAARKRLEEALELNPVLVLDPEREVARLGAGGG